MAKSNRRKNRHHLLWEGRSYNGVRKMARELPCAIVDLDTEVHAILHKLYGPPKLISEEDAAWLVQRHQHRHCACYDQNGNIATNILDINRREDDDA